MRLFKAAACLFMSSAFFLASPASARGDLRAEAFVGLDQISQGTSPGMVNVIYQNNVSGATYGGAIGYDLPVAPMVMIGADAEIGGSTGRRNSGENSFRTGRDVYVGGRVTVRVLPWTRIYAKVGYANANFISHQSISWTRGQILTFDDNAKLSGIRAGVGVQQTIFGPAYIMAEYRFSHYSSEFKRNQFVTGVGLRF